MTAFDIIRFAMQLSESRTLELIKDMRDAPLTAPTSRGGNHPLWVLGHLAFVEGLMFHVLTSEPNPLAHWAPLFAPGTEPSADAAQYPSFDTVLEAYRKHRARNIQAFEALGPAGMAKPTKAPPKGLEEALGTIGQTFMIVALHQMSHLGQVADARRSLGRAPLFVFPE